MCMQTAKYFGKKISNHIAIARLQLAKIGEYTFAKFFESNVLRKVCVYRIRLWMEKTCAKLAPIAALVSKFSNCSLM